MQTILRIFGLLAILAMLVVVGCSSPAAPSAPTSPSASATTTPNSAIACPATISGPATAPRRAPSVTAMAEIGPGASTPERLTIHQVKEMASSSPTFTATVTLD